MADCLSRRKGVLGKSRPDGKEEEIRLLLQDEKAREATGDTNRCSQNAQTTGSKTPGCRMHSLPIPLELPASRIFWRTEERAQRIAGHADSRTTKLYDRRGQKVLLEDMERIRY